MCSFTFASVLNLKRISMRNIIKYNLKIRQFKLFIVFIEIDASNTCGIMSHNIPATD